MYVDSHAIVVPVERSLAEPERSVSVTVPWVVGVQVIVVAAPAWTTIPPVGAVMGLGADCAAASAARAEMQRASSFMLLMRAPMRKNGLAAVVGDMKRKRRVTRVDALWRWKADGYNTPTNAGMEEVPQCNERRR